MTPIPQRLREIVRSGPFDERRSAIFKLADEIAAELEAPAADAVPVVARGIQEWADSTACAGLLLVLQRDHLATVAARQARINALEARQVPASASDEYAVVWPDGGRFIANTLESARNYMSGAVPSCSDRGVEPPVIVRYVPAETVPYEPQPDTSSSKEQT